MSDSQIKVTDKRMFTRDGELREEYKNLERATSDRPRGADQQAARDERTSAPAAPSAGTAGATRETQTAAEAQRKDHIPKVTPTFLDLVGLLAEPVAVYLGDSRLPDGSSSENLELARLHIDLLEVLRKTTQGNLDANESAFLDDLLYRLRLRYVQKQG